jgi:flagellar basal-body rod modification protein FlgD
MQLSGITALMNAEQTRAHAQALALSQAQPKAASNSGTNGTTGSGSSNSTTNPTASLTSESTFLQLLIAQVKNQDPLNPTDSIQFVGQLVQYSELEQLMGINQGVQTLTGATDPTSSTNGSSNSNTTPKTNGTS